MDSDEDVDMFYEDIGRRDPDYIEPVPEPQPPGSKSKGKSLVRLTVTGGPKSSSVSVKELVPLNGGRSKAPIWEDEKVDGQLEKRAICQDKRLLQGISNIVKIFIHISSISSNSIL